MYLKRSTQCGFASARGSFAASLDRYEQQEQILSGRNSYSKTDTDATLMRMKEDHMKNGQLKAGYNLQISSKNQYVADYTLHPNPTDATTLIPHLEQIENNYGSNPEVLTANGGYGSEQNYEHQEKQGIEASVKYNYLDNYNQTKASTTENEDQ